MNPLNPAPDIVAVAGDWHGNSVAAEHAIKWAAGHGATHLVHCGDFGYWRECPETGKYLRRVTDALTAHDMVLLWVDGNHEDHTRLQQVPIHPETGLRKINPRLWHIPRGFRWEWHGKTWMGLGGAYSIDEEWRTPMVSWWPGEWITASELEYASRDGGVDVMVTHDCPLGVDIPSLRKTSGEGWPLLAVQKSQAHQKNLRAVVDAVKPAVLFHGHFHCRYSAVLEGMDYRTLIYGLAEDGSKMIDNVAIVHLTNGPAPELLYPAGPTGPAQASV